MRMMEDIRPVSYLKSNLADMLAQINDTHRPVIITQKYEFASIGVSKQPLLTE